MAAVNVAYDTLSSPREAARYRASLRSTHRPCSACEEAGGRWRQKGFKGRVFVSCIDCLGSGLVPKEKR